MKTLLTCIVSLLIFGNYSQAQTIDVETYQTTERSVEVFTAKYPAINQTYDKPIECVVNTLENQFLLSQKVNKIFHETKIGTLLEGKTYKMGVSIRFTTDWEIIRVSLNVPDYNNVTISTKDFEAFANRIKKEINMAEYIEFRFLMHKNGYGSVTIPVFNEVNKTYDDFIKGNRKRKMLTMPK